MLPLRRALVVFTVGLVLSAAVPVLAAPSLTVEGVLRGAGGGPVVDGKYTIVVRIWDAAEAGAELYKEILLAVPIQGGHFHAAIGLSEPGNPLPEGLFAEHPSTWIGVQIPDDPELPRVAMHAVPYALQSVHADVATTAGSAAKAAALDCVGCLEDSHLKFSYAGSTSKGGPAADVACEGCVGGVDLAAASVGSAQLGQAVVTAEKIADDAVGTAQLAVTFAAGETKGGKALVALSANQADVALDLKCSGCVGEAALAAGLVAKLLGPATTDKLGGVIVGKYLVVDNGGTLSVAEGVFLPVTGGKLTGPLEVPTLKVTGADGGGKGLQVGPVDAPCAEALAGTLRWTGEALEVCTGNGWSALYAVKNGGSKDQAAASCGAILVALPGSQDGAHWLDPTGGDSGDAVHVWCDMTTDGGGWALVYAIINGQSSPAGVGAVNAGALVANWSAQPAKLSDSTISSLASASQYRYVCGTQHTYRRFFLLSHPFANATGLVDNGDKCRTAVDKGWVTITTGKSSTAIGLASTPGGDGCGTCVDRCGGPSGSGFWNSWSDYFPTKSNNGCYIKGVGYTNGWMWVK